MKMIYEVCVHKTSVKPPLYIGGPERNQGSVRSCKYVLGVLYEILELL